MAAGRPIINTSLDTAVPRVARHGIEAITVPPGNHARLAEAIETLLRDPERRRRMGHAAWLRAATQYSADAFRKRIQTVYRHAVTAKASSRSAHASRPGTIGWRGAIKIAAALAWSDVRHQYARSVLGPFWMSIQMAIMVAVLGFVIGHFSNTSAASHLPMLALSLTAWTFFSGVVLDATTALQNAASLIKDRALPPVIFLLQCSFRQALFAFHNASVPLALWLLLRPGPVAGAVAALPGFALFIICTLGLNLVLGALATRFRDIKPIIESSLMLAFLSSPIAWTPEMLDHGAIITRYNPLTHLFAVWREPLAIGHAAATTSLAYVLVCLAVLALASVVATSHLRKAAFWI